MRPKRRSRGENPAGRKHYTKTDSETREILDVLIIANAVISTILYQSPPKRRFGGILTGGKDPTPNLSFGGTFLGEKDP